MRKRFLDVKANAIGQSVGVNFTTYAEACIQAAIEVVADEREINGDQRISRAGHSMISTSGHHYVAVWLKRKRSGRIMTSEQISRDLAACSETRSYMTREPGRGAAPALPTPEDKWELSLSDERSAEVRRSHNRTVWS